MSNLSTSSNGASPFIQELAIEDIEMVGGGNFWRVVVQAVDWAGRGLTVATLANASEVDMGSFGQYEQNRSGGNYR